MIPIYICEDDPKQLEVLGSSSMSVGEEIQ